MAVVVLIAIMYCSRVIGSVMDSKAGVYLPTEARVRKGEQDTEHPSEGLNHHSKIEFRRPNRLKNRLDSLSLVMGSQFSSHKDFITTFSRPDTRGHQRRPRFLSEVSSSKWAASLAALKGDIDEVQLDLESSVGKTRGVSSCRQDLREACRHCKRASEALGQRDPQFQTAISRLRWGKVKVSRCKAAANHRGANSVAYYGQAEMRKAEEEIRLLLTRVRVTASEYNKQRLLDGSPLTSHDVLDGAGNLVSKSNSYFLTFDGVQLEGTRVKSKERYLSGIFSAQIKCPEEGSGLNTAFFLATDSASKSRSAIVMEFNGGNRSLVSLSVLQNGVPGSAMIVALGYDCADQLHTYSIAWSSTRIIWRNERSVLRVIHLKWWEESLPRDPMNLYLQLSLVNTVNLNSWTTQLESWGTNSMASFIDVSVQAPIVNSQIPAMEKLPPHAAWYPFGVNYCLNTMELGKNEAAITFNDEGCGGRIQTTTNFMYGQFTAEIKCAKGNTSGLVTSFYLSTMEGSATRDEIDFEFLGYTKTTVQTNVYVQGAGNREVFIDLGFDCSQKFHAYTIRYTKDSIVWFVDGEKKREYFATHEALYPSSPMFLYASVWNASFVMDGWWAGNWSGVGAPYTAEYRNFEINSPWLGRQ